MAVLAGYESSATAGAEDMANEEHLAILRQGVEVWNEWRYENRNIKPDLSGAKLNEANLSDTRLWGADLTQADLSNARLLYARLPGADLYRANLSGAFLRGADLMATALREAYLNKADLGDAFLYGADLREAILSDVHLINANLLGADLRGAKLDNVDMLGVNLRGADLRGARITNVNFSLANLVETRFENAILSKCRIYGISAWNIDLEGATQSDLIISKEGEPEITVDNLEIAQFVYLLLNNAKIRDVIDTLTTKAVLILGRFTDERKAVLDAIKNELRQRNYVPILFDFEKPASRDLTETIVTLAHLSRFVIADITDAKSIPQELQAIVPNLLSVPIQPIILAAQREYAMFEHFRRYPSVLPLHEYASQDQLIAELPEKVIEPAERKVMELRPKSV